MSGTILGVYNSKAIVQPTDSKPNRNIMVVGGPGSYKTQSYVMTNVVYETENSLVVTDPKAEVYENTAAIKEAQGFEVHVINFMNMKNSDRYNPLDYVRRDTEASIVANKMVESANADGRRDVWFLSQRALLKALILYAVNEFEPKDRNMRGIINFLQSYRTEHDEDGMSDLDRAFLQLPFEHSARKAYELGFKRSQGEMQGSIIVSLLSTISDYIDKEVAEFTSFSDFHMKDIGRKKMVFYVIIPVMDSTWEGLINLFFQQLFDQMYELGAENHSVLPIPVTLMLEEFVNLGKFEQYETFLATCRGYGIGVSTIIQTITQLQHKYGEKRAESILGNCAVKICLNAANNSTAQYFSKLLGTTTVKVETESQSKQHGKESRSSSRSENEQYVRRDLMTADEIAGMPDDTSIICFSNKRPIKAKKAFQFKVFPGILGAELRSQITYEKQTSFSQLQLFEEKEVEFREKKTLEQEAKLQSNLNLETENLQEQHDKLAEDFFWGASDEEEKALIRNEETKGDNEESEEDRILDFIEKQ